MCTKSFPVIDMVATGKNIVRLRKESGLTVADLQDYFGFEAPQAIYKWQKGISLPSTDNLLALGYLLDVAMEEILVTRPMAADILPQEESCGGPRFGSSFSSMPGNAGTRPPETRRGSRLAPDAPETGRAA